MRPPPNPTRTRLDEIAARVFEVASWPIRRDGSTVYYHPPHGAPLLLAVAGDERDAALIEHARDDLEHLLVLLAERGDEIESGSRPGFTCPGIDAAMRAARRLARVARSGGDPRGEVAVLLARLEAVRASNRAMREAVALAGLYDRASGRRLLDALTSASGAVEAERDALVRAEEAADRHIDRIESENARLRDDVARLRSIMLAAAEEIEEVYDAHRDPDGFGPETLLRALRSGSGDYRSDVVSVLVSAIERRAKGGPR